MDSARCNPWSQCSLRFAQGNVMSDCRPLVSICLPVYNGEKYVREAITSILEQTFKDFELIISDNASTDRTHEIGRDASERDRRVRYFRAR
jgi:glycosyltransferase involved in cell wall biosynthesis